MTAKELIDKYIQFFEKLDHTRIANSALIPKDDPTTLFTSSGMQPLVQYLLGEPHPQGSRLVNVQNSFRAVDIEEVGDNRHTTFFRMLGNWSLGDYFKTEEIPWLWEFLTKELGLPKEKLYVTVFAGTENGDVPFDSESDALWRIIFSQEKMEPRIFKDKTNWWSRSGPPDKMPPGEPGGSDTEVYYRFDDLEHGKDCRGDDPTTCVCGKFLEIANSVFMQYKKEQDGSFSELPKRNVDFGGGLERLLAAVENKSDIFMTSLFTPIVSAIVEETGKKYKGNEGQMRIVADHFIASLFIAANGIAPSKNGQGYVLRRLLRRGFDNFKQLEGKNIELILEKIVEQYSNTDEVLAEKFEELKYIVLEEKQNYEKTVKNALLYAGIEVFETPPPIGNDSTEVVKEISAEDAFKMYATHGLSPTQIKSLGYTFDGQKFAVLMEEHQTKSRTKSAGMFKGGLADHSEVTIKGHTATHLLHQALRDMLGSQVHQTGSNITSERVRFDFNYDKALTPEEIENLEQTVNEKMKENLPVHFEMMPLSKAKALGAIGLFDEKYSSDVKVYFIGDYSKEFCGGPHVEFTSEIKTFKIIKQENLGRGQRRLYAKVT